MENSYQCNLLRLLIVGFHHIELFPLFPGGKCTNILSKTKCGCEGYQRIIKANKRMDTNKRYLLPTLGMLEQLQWAEFVSVVRYLRTL